MITRRCYRLFLWAGLGFPAWVCSATPLTILTNDLHLAYIGQAYDSVLTTASGTAPYSWTVSSGQLPTGLALNSTTGHITGTPTQGGQFSVTIGVQDSVPATGSKTLTLQVFEQNTDQYGGLTNLPCSNGVQSHFYTQKIGSRWHLCTPAGNAFWMNGVFDVIPNSGTDYQGVDEAALVNSKYASGYTANATLNWSLQAVRRLQSWGFNTLAEIGLVWTLPVAQHSDWGTADSTIPVKLPFVSIVSPSWYSMVNENNYASGPVKDLMAGVKTGVYTGYRSNVTDYWDGNFAQWLQGDLANEQSLSGPHNDYLISFAVDDADYLQGFGAGLDFPTTGEGALKPGYYQTHLGWIVLVTAPTQSSNSSLGITYTDTTVYSKLELSTWLSSRYSSNITNLNTAWGSHYTTFGSSGGWGVGSGVLDEDGLCPTKTTSCWVPTDPYGLTGATTQMQTDLNDFLLLHAQHYFSTIKSALQTAAPGVLYSGPTSIGGYGTPSRRQVLQAAGQYVDVLTISGIPQCSDCTDLQQRIDFTAQYGGDKPWIAWEGFAANADSYMSPSATGTDWLATQAARGTAYSQMVQTMVGAKDTATGTYHSTGFRWWAMYDSRAESTNWGLITPRDDPYDGLATTTTAGADSWGYSTGCLSTFGCEQQNYGDFLTPVTNANLNVLRTIVNGVTNQSMHGSGTVKFNGKTVAH